MDPVSFGLPQLLIAAVAYWVVGGTLWVRRGRRAIRRTASVLIAETPEGARKLPDGRIVLELSEEINLVRVAAFAFGPPIAVALLWIVLR